jgi:glycosyltransferase involved in cell wall biosynthesis
MRPLHICFISQEYPPETGWGGIGAYTYEMAYGLARAGQRVTVIARADGPETVQRCDGVEVHRVRHGPDWGRWKGLWRLNRVWPGFAWAAARRLRHVQAENRVDVVEAAECRADGLFVSLLPGMPRLIVRLHTAWIFVDRMNCVVPDRKKCFIYHQEACALRRANLITAPSRAIVRLTNTWVPLPRRVGVPVVPNPVNTATFAPARAADSGEILVVGRLEVNKGVLVLEEAIPQVLRRSKRASFRLVGSDGTDAAGRSWRKRILDGLSSSERNRVRFECTTREELIDRYRRAEVCVLPSLWENFPYALLEALSCGVAVVGTRTGGIPELIEDGVTGLIVPPADAPALGDSICTLLDDAGLRRRLGAAARQRVEERFSVTKVVPEMLKVYGAVRGGEVVR